MKSLTYAKIAYCKPAQQSRKSTIKNKWQLYVSAKDVLIPFNSLSMSLLVWPICIISLLVTSN